MLTALLVAAAAALGLAAGYTLCHHQHTAALNRLTRYENTRERQFAAAADQWRKQLPERARRHTPAVSR